MKRVIPSGFARGFDRQRTERFPTRLSIHCSCLFCVGHMTIGVIIMNKRGVAVAADSALTVRPRGAAHFFRNIRSGTRQTNPSSTRQCAGDCRSWGNWRIHGISLGDGFCVLSSKSQGTVRKIEPVLRRVLEIFTANSAVCGCLPATEICSDNNDQSAPGLVRQDVERNSQETSRPWRA